MNASTKIVPIIQEFEQKLNPHETGALVVLTDNMTGAQYCECHVQGTALIKFGTIDAPLDPAQPGYKANRRLLTDEPAFLQMKEDALKKRTFSNIVAEYEFGADLPLKIVGGQHRFEAIRYAVESKINELHGMKVYFGLDMKQRIDVQTISNTNLAISGAWVDRLRETFRGPALRDWCQKAGLLKAGQDFSDKTGRGTFPVHLARTFIVNFYEGKEIETKKFAQTETTPILYKAGKDDKAWEDFLADHTNVWKDQKLLVAGQEYAKLIAAQKKAFSGKTKNADYAEKAINAAVLSAWAYTAGMLQKNAPRLKHHYAISNVSSPDPLNAKALAGGRHVTDPTNYRGLGYRVDARERGQMVELFFIVAEDGAKINSSKVKVAIMDYFAKKAVLDAKKARAAS